MATQLLYKDFLNNKKTYHLAQGYWRRMIDSVLAEQGQKAGYKTYLSGLTGHDKDYDGNPIFAAYFPELNKGLRIIQAEPENGTADISAWLDTFEIDGVEFPELVIDLVLAREVLGVAPATRLSFKSLGKIVP